MKNLCNYSPQRTQRSQSEQW